MEYSRRGRIPVTMAKEGEKRTRKLVNRAGFDRSVSSTRPGRLWPRARRIDLADVGRLWAHAIVATILKNGCPTCKEYFHGR